MRTWIRWLIVLAVAALAVFAASQLISIPDNVTATPSATAEPAGRPADAVSLRVDFVHDGDTLFLTDQRGTELTARLIGVDTPELGTDCYANEARDYLRELLPEGTEVWAEPGEDPQDWYGRELLYLWTASDELVNHELVEQGYAEAVRIGANDEYWPLLSAAEDDARAAGRGLWGAC